MTFIPRLRRSSSRMGRRWVPDVFQQLLTVRNVLAVLWAYLVWKGERRVFDDAVKSCDWNAWETWPSEARPHHIALVADPQIVDAHSYPKIYSFLQRPIQFFTDLYLYRTYSVIQQRLRPDTTIFLGDLFDGGREWSTEGFEHPNKRYKAYGDKYFAEEYSRLSRIYFQSWKAIDEEISAKEGKPETPRRLICSLPGNHDIGFGNGVHRSIRERFVKWFGPVDRVDVVGNHTFVSVDTPSFSAVDQYIDRSTVDRGSPNIWNETAEFLEHLDAHKQNAIAQELALLGAREKHREERNHEIDGENRRETENAQPDFLPSILLTHVPLWREPNTPCGPLREQYRSDAASRSSPSYEGDAIRVVRGRQYQTVLTDRVTNTVMQAAGPSVRQIYSGDDHDYCEVTHDRFDNAPREVTVKSTSFVMGVRRPGVMLVSLWNPLDLSNSTAITASQSSPRKEETIQDHLCLLPDQIGTWLGYAHMALFTVVVLIIQAFFTSRSRGRDADDYFAQRTSRKSETRRNGRHEEGLLPLKLANAHKPDPLLAPRQRNLFLPSTPSLRFWHALLAAPLVEIVTAALLWYLVLLVTWSC